MKPTTYILSVFIVIVSLSCRKNGHATVTGHVFELGTNTPIQGVEVSVVESNSPLHPFSGKSSNPSIWSKVIATSVTDSDGKYVLYFKKRAKHRYYIGCRDSSYHFGNADDLTYRKETRDFALAPFAYLKIRVIKTSYSNNTLEVRLNTGDVIYPYSPSFPVDSVYPYVFKVKGNSENRVDWNVYKDPVPAGEPSFDIYQGSIYINKNDTATYTISFN